MKMCRQDPGILHPEEMRFLREWVESMGSKIPPATHKINQKKRRKKKQQKVEGDIKTNKPSSEENDPAIDHEDVIEADTDAHKKRKVNM